MISAPPPLPTPQPPPAQPSPPPPPTHILVVTFNESLLWLRGLEAETLTDEENRSSRSSTVYITSLLSDSKNYWHKLVGIVYQRVNMFVLQETGQGHCQR